MYSILLQKDDQEIHKMILRIHKGFEGEGLFNDVLHLLMSDAELEIFPS